MVCTSKARRVDPGARVLGASRVSLNSGFKIYSDEEAEKKRGSVATRVVSRKSMPAAMSTKTSALPEMHAGKVTAKNIKKDACAKNNSDPKSGRAALANISNLKSGRIALANISNLKAGRTTLVNTSNLKAERTALANVNNLKTGRASQPSNHQNNSIAFKKESSAKSSVGKKHVVLQPVTIKLKGTKVQPPRNSLTKGTVAANSSSSELSSQDKNKDGYKFGKNLISAGNTKDFVRHPSRFGAKARRRSFCSNISSKKVGIPPKHKADVNQEAKLMSISGNGNKSSSIAMTTSPQLQNVLSDKSKNSLVDQEGINSLESCVNHVCAAQPIQGFRRRRSYTLTLMSGSKAIEKCSLKTDGLPDIDDRTNPLEVVEYVDDIYEYYWNMEDQTPLLENYLDQQKYISPRMRGVLIDWLIEVHLKFCLMQETLFLMVQLLDRALSVIPIEKDELQLVGLTAVLISSKYEDFWHPKVKDLISISLYAYTRQNMLTMERLMLERLKFRLNLPTPYVFMLRFLKASQTEKKLGNLAYYLIELCLVEYEALRFKPSLLCASAVYLARCTVHVNPPWSELLRKHARYEEKELRPCANMILSFQRSASKSSLKTTYEKFLEPEWDCVANIKAIEKLPP